MIWNTWILSFCTEVFYLWVGFAFLSILIFNLLCSKTGKRGRDEQLRAMHNRKKMALFPVRNTHDVAGTTRGNDSMVFFDLASRALIKLCVMYWNVQTHWGMKYGWSFSTFPTLLPPMQYFSGEKKGSWAQYFESMWLFFCKRPKNNGKKSSTQQTVMLKSFFWWGEEVPNNRQTKMDKKKLNGQENPK